MHIFVYNYILKKLFTNEYNNKYLTGGKDMPSENKYEGKRCGIDLSTLENANIISENNKSLVVGVLKSDLEISYISSRTEEVHYKTIISIARKSGEKDSVRIMIAESLIDGNREKLVRGMGIKVTGTLCSHLHKEFNKNRLLLYILAQSIELVEESAPEQNNMVLIRGKVHRPPFAKRSVGGKKITELFVSVKRNDSMFDYIPCVTWGRAAYQAEDLEVGEEVLLAGRIQSRSYWEKGTETKRIIYEVSVFGIL